MKGYSVFAPFRAFFQEMGITEITDIYGHTHTINEIDCIWNVTMFKGHKLFKDAYGDDAFHAYINVLQKYHYKLGISKYSHHTKDLNLMAKMNFQYLQCLDLWNPEYIRHYEERANAPFDSLNPETAGKIVRLAGYSTDLFEKIIKGDKFYTYKFLGMTDTDEPGSEIPYIEALRISEEMLNDIAIRRYLHQKLTKAIKQMKLGKIYISGFYHTLVGDILGYLQYAAGLEPTGTLAAGEFYARTLPAGDVLSFRSPLVCPSEVNNVTLVETEWTRTWLSYFKDQDVVMINMHDLTLPRQGGADEDGDAVFLCNDPIILASRIDKPIIIDIDDKATAQIAPYTQENIVLYELNSRDNRIGEITNVATSIENKYTTNPELKKIYASYASLLRIYQGKEIDYLKTGLRWHMSRGLRKYLKQLPLFLLYNYPEKLKKYETLREKNKDFENPEDRLPLNAYFSPSPMNELCQYVNTWEKKHLIWDNSCKSTKALLLNRQLLLDNKELLRKVRHLINAFSVEWKAALQQKNEQHTADDIDPVNLDGIIAAYKKQLSQLESDPELLANYVIAASYATNATNKTLAWKGYSTYLLKNLRDNSSQQKRTIITEVSQLTGHACEYLGKFYEMKHAEACAGHQILTGFGDNK